MNAALIKELSKANQMVQNTKLRVELSAKTKYVNKTILTQAL
jgi:hypothetical protein